MWFPLPLSTAYVTPGACAESGNVCRVILKELQVKQNRFNSSSIIRYLAVLGWLLPAAVGLATLVPQQAFAQG